jgi:hypothetical protein
MRAVQLASMILAGAASPVLAQGGMEADISSNGIITQSGEGQSGLKSVVSAGGRLRVLCHEKLC